MMMQGGEDSWNRVRRMRAREEQMCYQGMRASSISKGGLVVAWLCDQPDS